MSSTDPTAETLISNHPSTSGLQIALHPLALLTISDYITRHTLRQGKGPIIGALLGAQNGREISIEHAYEVVALEDADGKQSVEIEWFKNKLELFKTTQPHLDLIGWFTTTNSATFEPSPANVGVHQQLLDYNESLIMLLLNASPAASIGGKLPLSIYESVYEADERDPTKALGLKFVPLKYTIETGEAERIGMDMVAKSAQTAVDIPLDVKDTSSGTKGKGKEKEKDGEEGKKGGKTTSSSVDVGPQNDELISQLTARRNAIVMLTSRIKLLLKFLQEPPAGVTNQQILREIKSLTHSRLPLLKPADPAAFETEKLAEEADVNLVVLLGELTKSIEGISSVGKKFGGIQMMEKRVGSYRQDPHDGMESFMPIGGPRRGRFGGGGGGFGAF